MNDNDSTLPPNPADLPEDPERRRVLTGLAAVGIGLALAGCKTEQNAAAGAAPRSAADLRLDAALRDQVKHIVVIYAENRSFANLYGNFPGVQHPLDAVSAERYLQLDRDGKTALPQLPKIWGGLVPQAQEVDGKR
jgi:acid phosphatase